MLTNEIRELIKREIHRVKKEHLRHEGRLTARGRHNDGLEPGSAQPWFPVARHIPSDHHRILPSLDVIEGF